MAPKETPPAPGRTAQIVAVASLTLAIAVTVAALTGRIGRKAEPAAAPAETPVAAPGELPALIPSPAPAGLPAEAVSTPGSPVGPLPAPQPILLVPVQPAADQQAAEPALPSSPDDQVAGWRGGDDDDDEDEEREHHGRRHHEDDDDDDD